MPAQRKTLLCIIICLTVVLGVLLGAVGVLHGSGLLSTETTGPSIPGTSSTSGVPGTTTRPAAPTTRPTIPTTLPTIPTTLPTIPTTLPTIPTTLPTIPTTQPTVPTTLPTVPTTQPTVPTTLPTVPTTQPTVPSQPTVHKIASATISTTGDFLMNLPCVNTADIVNGEHDFANMFTYFKNYVSAADMAIGNLETTLAGANYVNSDGTIGYHGSYRFNSPDGIVPSLKAAGFDLLLTANNHTYDTTTTGFYRTQQIMKKYGMPYLGTVDAADIPLWQIHNVNGIRIGMICYTYETNDDPAKTALNGIPMNSETAALIGTFSYGQLETFYEELDQQIKAMENAGAEAVMLFIHWGDEYQVKQNATQSAMAQRICDLGVDVIVGGHPHVLQPVDLLTSTKDAEHKTVCIYSLGNAMSNQRISEMSLKTGHTEDGALFSVTFAKYSDGTVMLENADVLPTWVDMHTTAEGKKLYSILPLDDSLEDWKTAFQLTDSRLKLAENSYKRSMKIVGAGLEEVQEFLAKRVADMENADSANGNTAARARQTNVGMFTTSMLPRTQACPWLTKWSAGQTVFGIGRQFLIEKAA